MQFRKDIRMKNSSRFSMWFHRPVRIKYSNWLTNALNFEAVSLSLINCKENSLSQLHKVLFRTNLWSCLFTISRSVLIPFFLYLVTFISYIQNTDLADLIPPKKQRSQNKSKHAQKLNVNISDIYTYLSRPPQIHGQQYIVEVNPLQDRLNLNSIWCTACEILTYLSLLSGLWKSRYSGVYLLRLLLIHKTLWR